MMYLQKNSIQNRPEGGGDTRYQAPEIETIVIAVEKGFAQSEGTQFDGELPDFPYDEW